MNALQESFENNLSWNDIAKHFKTDFIITKGEDGIYICKHDSGDYIHIPVDKKNVKGNTLGAGDLIVSSTIYQHILKNKPLTEAIKESFKHILKILDSDGVHLGKQNALRLSIQSAFSQADTDELTGMLNRNGFYKNIENKGIINNRFAIGLFDIDYFKSVNDTYGHHVGDIVLQKVAKVILSETRSGECSVRWGGEEFLITLINVNKEDGLDVLNRIRHKISLLKIDEIDKPLTLSAGLAFSSKNPNLEETIKYADEALYEAKNTGRNKVVVKS